jgi:dCTP deaminase
MILKADEIAHRLNLPHDKAADRLYIRPQPTIESLQESGAASVDLRLGTWFVTLRQHRLPLLDVISDPSTRTDDSRLSKTRYVPFGEKFFLHPHSFVLGVTLEWIRFPNNLAGYVVGRSSWGRRGLIIATAAGVHPGFTGCLTLELTNVGEVPVAVMPGMTICQLFIHQVQTNSALVDKSSLVGRRQPTVGRIELDEIARKLALAQIS